MSVVTHPMFGDAWEAYVGIEDEPPNLMALKAALAAVAPLIAKAERERCIAIARNWSRNGQSPTAHGIIMGIEGDTP